MTILSRLELGASRGDTLTPPRLCIYLFFTTDRPTWWQRSQRTRRRDENKQSSCDNEYFMRVRIISMRSGVPPPWEERRFHTTFWAEVDVLFCFSLIDFPGDHVYGQYMLSSLVFSGISPRQAAQTCLKRLWKCAAALMRGFPCPGTRSRTP